MKQNTILYKQSGHISKLLSLIIFILLGISLYPGTYIKVAPYLFGVLLAQFLLALLTLNLASVLFIILITIFSAAGFVPFLGWFFRLGALMIALFNVLVNPVIIKKVVKFGTGVKKEKKKEKPKKIYANVQDAQFKEK